MTDIPQPAFDAARSAVCKIPSHNPGYISAFNHTIVNDLSRDLIDTIVNAAVTAAAPFILEKHQKEIEQLKAKMTCMCGDDINHSAWSGHTPVSMYDHSLDQIEQKNVELLATIEQLRANLAQDQQRLFHYEANGTFADGIEAALDAIQNSGMGDGAKELALTTIRSLKKQP